ncbi:MAG: redox-sensing transcriptional repressor Rex, partial [Verrucomicrobiales bacterium]|nr:redox-sensing transcriptional repressor Rex [Verrucomicrobiales bacterium]
FKKEGFEIIAAFDKFPEMVEERSPNTGIPIHNVDELKEYITAHEVKMAILAVPGESAQDVANILVASGVQAILNFSPLVLQVPEDVIVNHVDLAVELESLSYFIS